VNYHRPMGRHTMLAFAAVAACTLVVPAAPAHAEPTAPPCTFTMSPPQLVQVSGTTMVTATVGPGACHVAAEPTLSVVCLQLQGSQTAAQCAQLEGPSTAHINFAPYRPGATYVATGRGCALVGNPPRSICQATGPLTATL
jgi:hypothetical protein